MLRKVLHSKIHMGTCTAANHNYIGSITIDEDLLDAIGLRVNDVVLIANCRNGARLETYVFKGERGSGKIELNGASAHLIDPGDKLIILHWALMDDEEYARHHPKVVFPTDDNKVGRTMQYEPGKLYD